MKVAQLLGYINARYIAIYLFFFFYFIVSFGAGTSAHYRYAPHLLLASLLCVYIYRNGKNNIMKMRLLSPLVWLTIFVVIFSVNYLWFEHPLCPYSQYLSYSLLPYVTCFALYRFASNGEKEFELLLLIFIVFFITAIIRFFHEANTMKLLGSDFRSNNAFYQVLMPLPILFFLRNKASRLLLLSTTIFICILSIKRSALIAIILISAFYLYKEVLTNRKSRFYTTILFIFSTFVLLQYADLTTLSESFNKVTERLEQISEDGGSGRFDMIEKFFNHDLMDGYILLGNGFMGYHDKYPGVLASHNDLIETYYSYGIIGLMLFIIFLWRLLKKSLYMLGINSPNTLSYIAALILFILYTFAGGCFTFINLSLPFFSFIAISQAQHLTNED